MCDETNNTGEVIDRNEFIAEIFVKPNRSINFITLSFVATRTGISLKRLQVKEEIKNANINDFKTKLAGGVLVRTSLSNNAFSQKSYAQVVVKLKSVFMSKYIYTCNAIGTTTLTSVDQSTYWDRTFEPWTIKVLNDTNFKLRDAFERWQKGINNMSDNEGLVNPADYQVDAFIDHLDRNGTTIKSYTLRVVSQLL